MKTINYNVIFNVSPWGSFKAGRGLRQGDPISPYLFIMIVVVLGRSLFKLLVLRTLIGIKAATTIPSQVIQYLVDDTFLYGYSSVMEATI